MDTLLARIDATPDDGLSIEDRSAIDQRARELATTAEPQLAAYDEMERRRSSDPEPGKVRDSGDGRDGGGA